MGKSSIRAVGWARSLPLGTDVKAARDWARDRLAALGWTTSAPRTVDAVLLTVSELVTNARIHARSNAQLVLSWDNRCLHVAVHDASARLPERRRPGSERVDSERIGGWGLQLVDALADDWEARPCPYGKTVIACFRPETAAEGEPQQQH